MANKVELYPEGTIVWARVKGYPWWPAEVTSVNTTRKTCNVVFYGSNQAGMNLKYSDSIKSYTEARATLVAIKKKVRGFQEAVAVADEKVAEAEDLEETSESEEEGDEEGEGEGERDEDGEAEGERDEDGEAEGERDEDGEAEGERDEVKKSGQRKRETESRVATSNGINAETMSNREKDKKIKMKKSAGLADSMDDHAKGTNNKAKSVPKRTNHKPASVKRNVQEKDSANKRKKIATANQKEDSATNTEFEEAAKLASAVIGQGALPMAAAEVEAPKTIGGDTEAGAVRDTEAGEKGDADTDVEKGGDDKVNKEPNPQRDHETGIKTETDTDTQRETETVTHRATARQPQSRTRKSRRTAGKVSAALIEDSDEELAAPSPPRGGQGSEADDSQDEVIVKSTRRDPEERRKETQKSTESDDQSQSKKPKARRSRQSKESSDKPKPKKPRARKEQELSPIETVLALRLELKQSCPTKAQHDEQRALGALKQLDAFPITMEILRETKIAAQVIKPLRKHPAKAISEAANALYTKWKNECVPKKAIESGKA